VKLGIVGSRQITFEEAKKHILKAIKKYKPTHIVSGGARGVDSHAEKIAHELGISVVIYKANWDLGLHAGFLRNTTIIENSDRLLAIFPGSIPSGGTKDTYKKAKKLGIPVDEVFLKDHQLSLFPTYSF